MVELSKISKIDGEERGRRNRLQIVCPRFSKGTWFPVPIRELLLGDTGKLLSKIKGSRTVDVVLAGCSNGGLRSLVLQLASR